MNKLESLYGNYHESKNLLEKSLQSFKRKVGLAPFIGVELEFYILNASNLKAEFLLSIVNSIKIICQNQGINIKGIKAEEGNKQYEIIFAATENLLELAENILQTKVIVKQTLLNNNLEVSFAAKPYADQESGNGMHINLSLLDKENHNIFAIQEIKDNNLLLSAIAGLLNLLPASMVFFVTNNKDFMRFKAKIKLDKEELRYKCSSTNAPINVSWGVNNRTTALRIVNSEQENNRRIEHRVPSANANPYLAFIAILSATEYGVIHKMKPAAQIWGNAFDKQYSLQPLPINMQDALEHYRSQKILSL